MGWASPPGARSDLIAHVDVPEHWLEHNIVLKWSTPSVSADFVAWQARYRNEGLGPTDVQLASSALAFRGTWANLTASPYYTKMSPSGASGHATDGSSMAAAVPITTCEATYASAEEATSQRTTCTPAPHTCSCRSDPRQAT